MKTYGGIHSISSLALATALAVGIGNGAFCHARNSGISLPLHWQVTWYQWLGPNRIICKAGDPSGNDESQTVTLDTRTGTVTKTKLGGNAEFSIFNNSFRAWQVSPDRRLLMGLGGGGSYRVAIDMNWRERIRVPKHGAHVRWTSDGQSWIEWDWVPQRNTTKLVYTSLPARHRGRRQRVQSVEIPGEWSNIAPVAHQMALMSRPVTATIGSEWTVRTIDLRYGRRISKDWILKVPGMRAIRANSISNNQKSVCWLLDCASEVNPPPVHNALDTHDNGDMKFTAEMWISAVNGEGLRRVAKVDVGPQTQIMSYYLSPSSLNWPLDLQWVPGDQQLSFLNGGRIRTVDIP